MHGKRIDAGRWLTFLVLNVEMHSALLPINSVNNVSGPGICIVGAIWDIVGLPSPGLRVILSQEKIE